jgi:hypothetical protein
VTSNAPTAGRAPKTPRRRGLQTRGLTSAFAGGWVGPVSVLTTRSYPCSVALELAGVSVTIALGMHDATIV